MTLRLTGLLLLAWVAGTQASPPATIALLVDTSDSMTGHNPFRKGDPTLLTDAAAGLAAAMRADDTAAVDTFGPTINVSPPVRHRDELARAADALNDGTGGTSPLWDALDAVLHSPDHASGPRAVIVVTDGRTTANKLSFGEILARVQQAGVPLYVICAERASQRALGDPSVRLRQIATATGGQYYIIGNYSGLGRPKPAEVAGAIRRAMDEIRKERPPARD